MCGLDVIIFIVSGTAKEREREREREEVGDCHKFWDNCNEHLHRRKHRYFRIVSLMQSRARSRVFQ